MWVLEITFIPYNNLNYNKPLHQISPLKLHIEFYKLHLPKKKHNWTVQL